MKYNFLIILVIFSALILGLIIAPKLILIIVIANLILVLLQNLIQLYGSFLSPMKLKVSKLKSQPLVSILVPSYNEPPALLKNTLKKISQLDYQNYEVLVIDNNTKDPAIWSPIKSYCHELGKKFRFFHEDKLDGFKAGALNYLRNKIDPQAQYIAIVDADYEVNSEFIKEALKYFTDDNIALVQFPQAHLNVNLQNIGIKLEYEHFFRIYMNLANFLNSVTSTGTVSVYQARALRQVDFFDKNCLTEDADIGLKIIQAGFKTLYIDKIIGRGFMPYDIEAYKKQKIRWAWGNSQIIKNNFFKIILDAHLTFKQKIGIFVIMTAWFNLTILPILALFGTSILYPTNFFDQQVLMLIMVFSAITIYVFCLLKFASFIVAFMGRYSFKNIFRSFLVHLGMGGVYSLTFFNAFFNTAVFFERTNKFILIKMPSVIKNTSLETILGVISLLFGLTNFINHNYFVGFTLLLISLIYFLIFYVNKEILPTKKLSAKILGEMK